MHRGKKGQRGLIRVCRGIRVIVESIPVEEISEGVVRQIVDRQILWGSQGKCGLDAGAGSTETTNVSTEVDVKVRGAVEAIQSEPSVVDGKVMLVEMVRLRMVVCSLENTVQVIDRKAGKTNVACFL
jgi:hypothetical protein